ncbi:MAG TPA: M1 family metallopeptidase, partial [Thermoplasmata archaeon]|nr:M1 family metallopeptidase [Thermoplasmata archaeon]
SDSASFSVTVPKNFKVVKLEEGRIENSDFKYVAGEEPVVRSENNKTTYFFKSNPFGFSFVCSDYVSTLDTKDGVFYKVYLSPGHENMLKPVTTLSKKLIDFYSDKYYPYSLSEFRVVEAEGIGTIHVNDEYSTCLSTFNYSTHLYEGLKDLGFEKQMSKMLERYFDSIAGVLVHETSHFWFGGLVISEKLNEAFAVFSELLFTEHLDPNLSKELRKYYTDVLIGITDWQNVSLAEVTPYTNPNYNIIYYKGGMIIYMLYDILGDALFDVFHSYFEIYKGEPGAPEKASLEDFIALVNQKKDLKWFFDEWVYKPGLPAYALLNPSISYRNGEYRIDVDIIQKGEIYKMPVEIKVGKNIETFWVDSPVERVGIYSDSLPSRLILDPNWKIPRYGGEVWLNLTDG